MSRFRSILAAILLAVVLLPSAAVAAHAATHAHDHGHEHAVPDEDRESEDCPTCDLLAHTPTPLPELPATAVDAAPAVGLVSADGSPLYLTRGPSRPIGRAPPVTL